MPLPKRSSNPGDGELDWEYYLDDTTGEIVITNFRPIDNSARALSCGIEYHYEPHLVKSGVRNDFQVTWRIDDGSGSPQTTTSPVHSLTVNTSYPKPVVYKWGPTEAANNTYRGFRYLSWQDAWGQAPADADEYFYVQWSLEAHQVHGGQTMPYKIYFEELPESDGQLVGYAISKDTPNSGPGVTEPISRDDFVSVPGPLDNPQAQEAALTQFSEALQSEWNGCVKFNESVRWDVVARVIMRYPRTLLQQSSEGMEMYEAEISNSMKAIYVGEDGSRKETETRKKFNFAFGQYQLPPDELNISKGGESILGEGALDRLEEGLDTPIRWNLWVMHKGYRKSNGGTTPYSTALHDNLTESITHLSMQDYTYTGFLVWQFLEYDISVESALFGDFSTNKISTDYANYGTIDVYIKTRNNPNNWQHFGYVKHDDDTQYSAFYTPDGTRVKKQGGTSVGYVQSLVVDLPANTYDIQFIHRTTQAKVEFFVHLDMLLHPTANVRSLINDSDPYTLTNVASMSGMPGVITGAGNVKDDVSTYPNAQPLYDDGSVNLTHIHRFTRAEKDILGETQDTANALTRVKYDLTAVEWLYAGTYMPEELVPDFLPEQRHAVFYDLLPPGAMLDEQSLVVYDIHGREANYRFSLEYDWRQTGRTMLIVTADVRDETALNIKNQPQGLSSYDNKSLYKPRWNP